MFPSNNYNFGSPMALDGDRDALNLNLSEEELQTILAAIDSTHTYTQHISTLPLSVHQFFTDGTETELFCDLDVKPNPDQLVPPLQLSPRPAVPSGNELNGLPTRSFVFGGLPLSITSYVESRTVGARSPVDGQLVPSLTEAEVRRSRQRKTERNRSAEQNVECSPAEASSVHMYDYDVDSNWDQGTEEDLKPVKRSRSDDYDHSDAQSGDPTDRRERRREQNRRAARKCRDRRKEQLDKLKKDHDRVLADNIRQREQIAKLLTERKQLTSLLQCHEKSCGFKLR